MGIGSTELLIILIIVLVLFGGNRIPQIFGGFGKGIREFRKAMNGEDEKAEKSDKDKNSQGS